MYAWTPLIQDNSTFRDDHSSPLDTSYDLLYLNIFVPPPFWVHVISVNWSSLKIPPPQKKNLPIFSEEKKHGFCQVFYAPNLQFQSHPI